MDRNQAGRELDVVFSRERQVDVDVTQVTF
jgi:hypothetical protein